MSKIVNLWGQLLGGRLFFKDVLSSMERPVFSCGIDSFHTLFCQCRQMASGSVEKGVASLSVASWRYPFPEKARKHPRPATANSDAYRSQVTSKMKAERQRTTLGGQRGADSWPQGWGMVGNGGR